MNNMLVNQLNGVLDAVLKDENLLPNLARVMAKLRDELLTQGFTDDQAMEIIKQFKLNS